MLAGTGVTGLATRAADIDATAAARLRVVLLGGFGMALGDEPPESFGTPRLQSLVAYLLLRRDVPQLRQHLAYVLWPDSTDSQARTNLRNLLHRLSIALPDAHRFLEMGPAAIRWRPGARVSVDVAEFEADLARAAELEHAGNSAASVEALQAAVRLYRGEFLPGLYDEWIVPERERLSRLFVQALGQLIDRVEQRREYARAIEFAEQLLRHDELNEATYRQLMRLHALARDESGVRRVFERCTSVLRRELGVDPEPATRELRNQLSRIDAVADRAGATRSVRARLIGRHHEWLRLRRSFETAAAFPRLLLLTGEAGVGKTRLAEELLDWRRLQGDRTAVGHSYLGDVIPYAPLTGWLRAPDLIEAVAGLETIWLTEIARIVPEFLVDRPNLPQPQAMRENWQRQRLFEAIARAVLAGGRPLTLLLEDLQWCDQATLEWLRFFLRWPADVPVIVCATLRIEELAELPALKNLLTALRRDAALEQLEVGPLDSDETAALAAQVIGRRLGPAEAESLYRETEGNALYVVEAVRDGQPGSIPPSVQAVIMARLAQLSSGANVLAGLAATIGRSFTFHMVASASAQPEAELVSQFDELTRRRILRERQDGRYDFTHHKIRAVAYATLSAARRRMLHARVADTLETLQPDPDSISAELARHNAEAGRLERAVAWYQRAGQVATRVYASADAATYLRRAAVLLDSLPPLPGGDVWRAETGAAVLESLGDVLALTSQHAAALAAFETGRTRTLPDDLVGRARFQRKAGSACEGQRDYPAALAFYDLAEKTLENKPAESQVDWRQEWIALQLGRLSLYYWTANISAMSDVATRLAPVVDRYGTPIQRATYAAQVARSRYRLERYALSEQTVESLRLALGAALETGMTGEIAKMQFEVGFSLLWNGRLSEAEVALNQARTLIRQIGDAAWETRVVVYVATLFRLARLPNRQVRMLAEEALALASATDMPEYIGAAHGHLAWVALRDGNRDEASVHVRAALMARERSHTAYPFFWFAAWPLLDLALLRGDLAQAIEHARAMLDETQQQLPEQLSSRLEQAIRTWDTGDGRRARVHLEHARALARETGHL